MRTIEKNKVTCRSDSEDIRIYIDGILHLRFPRDKNIKIQARVEGHSISFVFEIWCAGHTDHITFDNNSIWSKILRLIDENI